MAQKRDTCRGCDGHVDQVGPLSRRGLCGECGPIMAAEAAIQLSVKKGPYWEKWKAGQRRAAERLLRTLERSDP